MNVGVKGGSSSGPLPSTTRSFPTPQEGGIEDVEGQFFMRCGLDERCDERELRIRLSVAAKQRNRLIDVAPDALASWRTDATYSG